MAQININETEPSMRVCKYPLCSNTFVHEKGSHQKYCQKTHYHPCPICGKSVVSKDYWDLDSVCSSKCKGIRIARSRILTGANDMKNMHLSPRKCMFPGCDNVFTPKNANQHYCFDQHYTTCQICGAKIPFHGAYSNRSSTCSKECAYILRGSTNSNKHVYIKQIRADQASQRSPRISQPMRDFANLINSFLFLVSFDYRIENFLYDISVVGTNILFELNPSITHNAYRDPWGHSKDQYYHARKSQVASENGYICIHIFDWDNPLEIWSSLINHRYILSSDPMEPKLHWFRVKDKSHILHDDTFVYEDMIQAGYLPVYDSGTQIEFI